MDFIVYSAVTAAGKTENIRIRRLPGAGLGRSISAKLQWPFRLMWAARELGHGGYGAIILRYPKLPFGWRTFLRRAGVPVITEHHTDELAEIRGPGGWIRQAASAVEGHVRAGFLRKVSGVIGVTPEITERIHAEAPQAFSATMTNGVDVASVPATGFVPFDGTVLRMVSVASEFVPWQGLDRLLNGMLTYPGAVRLELVLIGAVPEKLKELVVRSNRRPGMAVHCPGPAYGPELDARLGSANLAIASLALFRKQMVQACPLKVREYMARGIPFVYGYNDPDVPEDSEFALKVPAEDQPVNMEEVIRFAVRSARSPDLACRMRSYAHDVMDWRGKVKALYALARQTAERARCR